MRYTLPKAPSVETQKARIGIIPPVSITLVAEMVVGFLEEGGVRRVAQQMFIRFTF